MTKPSAGPNASAREQGKASAVDFGRNVFVVAENGRFYGEVTELLRAHAIVRLVTHGDPKGFSDDLITSARARRAFLHHQRESAHINRAHVRHCSGAFFDALAAGDLALAVDLARLAPSLCRPGAEREDDFLWHRTLGLLAAGAPQPTIEAYLARLARSVAHAGDPRPALCRALHTNDAKAFGRAFRCLLLRRESELETARRASRPDPYAALDEELYVEGIAVLKLARARGIAIAREYPMCPALALAERPWLEAKEERAVR